MLRLMIGRNHLLEGALISLCARVTGAENATLTVVVPRQITLETELALLDGLNLQGSFQLRVVSPERLCDLIFDAVGQPEGARVDERGRAMLVSRALKRVGGELRYYRGAQSRRGFVQRATRQVEIFRQAGLSGEEAQRLCEGRSGALAAKLADIARILTAYEEEIRGRFEDGEDALRAAACLAGEAAFLRGAQVCFYGFDFPADTLNGLIAAVAATAQVHVLMPFEGAPARDFDLFSPMAAAAARLERAARERNVRVERAAVADADARCVQIRHLSHELFACPVRPWEGEKGCVQLFEARNIRQEAHFAAALARRLVRTRGWRYRDIRVLVPNIDLYRQPLREAFAACEIPAFLAQSRSGARHALAECLLTALETLFRDVRDEDLDALLACGYLPVKPRDAARLRNYALSYGVRAGAFFRPFSRGPAAVIEALEPLRAQAMAPLIALRQRMRAAKNLRAQLEAVFAFLEDIRAYDRDLERRRALCEAALFEPAGEEGQVWNRILGALDQMHALLGEEKLPPRELTEHLRQSLEAAVVKPLPQSLDAVQVQQVERLSMRPVKAVLLLGQCERAAPAQDALLSANQLAGVSAWARETRQAEVYLGQTALEAARARLFYAKTGLEMASQYVLVSYPLAGADDAAERPGPLVAQLRQVFPHLQARGGLLGDERAEDLMLEPPGAAVARVAAALGGGALSRREANVLRALSGLKNARPQLLGLRAALDLRAAADRITPDAARRLYGALNRASVSRLELFAACPFAHFMRYGLRPELLEPYALSPRDEGVFFHDALRGLLAQIIRGENLDPESAAGRMDEVAQTLLKALRTGPLGQSAVSLAEERRLRGVARTAATLLVEQLRDSCFRPVGLELRFGQDGEEALRVGKQGDCTLYGAIDRVDEWQDASTRYVRVIDYKRGNRPFDPDAAWNGLQLQLLVYLAAAAKARSGRPAGAFYFRMDEGYVFTSGTDPAAVDELRHRALRMDGPRLEDEAVAQALSQNPRRYLHAADAMDGASLEGLIRRALEMAGAHVEGIRAGEAQPSPVRTGRDNPCDWCDWRGACLLDEEADRARVRRISPRPSPEDA